MGFTEAQTLQYVASDYIGDYDGAYHTIGWKPLNEPAGVKVEFFGVAALDDK